MQSLIARTEVAAKVESLWEKVFSNSNAVLTQHSNFGFHGVKSGSPSIEERLFQLQMIRAVLDILINHAVVGELEYEQHRQMLNAKQQITNMEMVAAAVKANQMNDYRTAVAALERQLPI